MVIGTRTWAWWVLLKLILNSKSAVKMKWGTWEQWQASFQIKHIDVHTHTFMHVKFEVLKGVSINIMSPEMLHQLSFCIWISMYCRHIQNRFFYPEDRGSELFRNIAKYLSEYMPTHPRRHDLYTYRRWNLETLKDLLSCEGFKVLVMVTMMCTMLCDVTRCSPIEVKLRFGKTYCLFLQSQR